MVSTNSLDDDSFASVQDIISLVQGVRIGSVQRQARQAHLAAEEAARKTPPPEKPPCSSPCGGSRAYTIDTILEWRELDGETQYLIKWEGYDASENTWEPEENIPEAYRHHFHNFTEGEFDPETINYLLGSGHMMIDSVGGDPTAWMN